MLDFRPDTGRAQRRIGIRGDAVTPVVMVLLAPVVAYVGTRLGIEVLNRSLDVALGPPPGGGEPMVEAGNAHVVAVAAAVAAALAVVRTRFATLPFLASWSAVEPERPVDEVLADLPESYRVVAGASTHETGDIVDHVVIGPTGVFTIETRTYSGGVVIDRGHARVNGRSLDGLVAQVSHSAGSIARQARCAVTPVVCANGGVRVDRFLGSPVVDGVRFCDAAHLVKTITSVSSVSLTSMTCDRIEREIRSH